MQKHWKRRAVAALAAAVLSMGGPFVPSLAAEQAAPATASSGWAPEAGSPWADVAPVDPALRAEFLATWTARFKQGDGAVRPTKAESAAYADLSAAQRRGLIVDLVNHWYGTVPGFADAMAGNKGGPAWTPGGLAGMAHTVIFEPGKLKGDPGRNDATAPAADSETTAKFVALQERATAALAGSPAFAVPAADVPAAPTAQFRAVDASARTGALAGLRLPDPGASQARSNSPVDDLLEGVAVDETDRVIARADDLLARNGVPIGLGNTHYRACQALPTGSECGPVTPLGAPALVPGGVDWQFVLGPFDLSQPGKVAFNLELTKTDPTSSRSGHFFVRYRPPYFDREVALGFGDRAPLHQNQSAAVTLEQPVATVIDKTMKLTARLRHNGPTTSNLALSMVYGDISGRMLLTRAPSVFTARASLPLSGSPLGFGITAPGNPMLTMEAALAKGLVTGTVENLPAEADLVITRGDNLTAAYNASGPIGKVTVTGDDLDAGGGLLDATATVEGVPAQATVVAGPGGVSATGSSGITKVTAGGTLRPVNGEHPSKTAAVTVTGIPASFSYAPSTVNGVPTHVYTASSKVTSVTGAYQETAANGSTVAKAGAVLTGLPSTLTLRLPAGGVAVDLGADQLDQIEAWASQGTGTVLTRRADLEPNQLQYLGTATTRQAYVSLLAFKGAGFSHSPAGGLTADVKVGGNRGLSAVFNEPGRSGSVKVSNVPGQITFTAEGNRLHYNAHGTVINRIDAAVNVPGLSATAVVTAIPGSVDLVNDLAGTGLAYTATHPIGGINVDVAAGLNRAIADVTTVPRAWTLVASKDKVDFDAPDGVGRITASVAHNGGSVPFMFGDHLGATFDQPAGRAAARLSISQLRKASYVNGVNRSFKLGMGNGGTLGLLLDGVLADGKVATLDGVISNVPTDVNVTLGNDGTIDARANSAATITLQAGYGPRAALNAITLPQIHGIAVRDANVGGLGYKGRVHLVGLPTRVTTGNGTFHVEGLFGQPGATTLSIDAVLDDTAPRRSLKAVLGGLATQPYVIDGTMTVTPVAEGGSNLLAQLITNRSLGSLSVAAAQDAVSGRAYVSNIPANVKLEVFERPGSTRAVWNTSQPINQIAAAVKAGFDGDVAGTVRGSLSVTDVPSFVDLTVGRNGAGDGPLVAYSANADSLDAFIAADGSLAVPNGNVNARFSFDLVNLARDVVATVDGSKRLSVRSPSGRTTGRIAANVNARANFSRSGGGHLNQGGAVSFPYGYGIDVNPVIENLFVHFEGLRSITIEPGVSSKLTGSWDMFHMGWNLIGASLSAWADMDVEIDWPWPFGSDRFDFLDASFGTPTLPLLVDFHTYINFKSRWTGFSWGIWGCGVNGGIDLKPTPSTVFRNGLAFNDPGDDGGAYYVTPNPYGILPGWMVDLVTFAVRPERDWGVSFGFSC